MALSAIIVSIVGLVAFLYGNRFVSERISRREALLAVSLIWIAAGTCGAVPFMLGAGMSASDSFFESVSGLTTTGATVIADIEGRLSRPLLLWRSLIQWLGGMGIVVLFVAVFPNLGAGGKHLFRGEVPGTTAEGLRPRIAETSFALWKLYGALTIIEIALLKILGLDLFDAVCHAFTTMSTGGFSTLDSSVGGFDRAAVEYVNRLLHADRQRELRALLRPSAHRQLEVARTQHRVSLVRRHRRRVGDRVDDSQPQRARRAADLLPLLLLHGGDHDLVNRIRNGRLQRLQLDGPCNRNPSDVRRADAPARPRAASRLNGPS